MAALCEVESIYTRALALDRAKDYARAFPLYLHAADRFLAASKASNSKFAPAKLSAFKSKAAAALDRAEIIKHLVQPPDEFSQDAQVHVLERSSVVNGRRVRPWSASDPAKLAADTAEAAVQPSLSPAQKEYGAVWLHPKGFCDTSVVTLQQDDLAQRVDDLSLCPSDSTPPLDNASLSLRPDDISQQIVEDCSLCAAIAVWVGYCARAGAEIAGNSALDGAKGRDSRNRFLGLHRHPVPSSHVHPDTAQTLYSLKIMWNGCWRRFVIDDRLPLYGSGNSPVSMVASMAEPMGVSTGTKRILWPSYVEKAYMKLMGGYDFPGSNSCNDLHALAGWVPEHIELQSATFKREETWTRILAGFDRGCCILTVGTPAASKPSAAKNAASGMLEWRGILLRPAHCLAVIDIQEQTDEHERLLTVLDPRAEPGSPGRTMTIPWLDICALFEGVYLSWDPALFKCRKSFHGLWKRERDADTSQDEAREARHWHIRLEITGTSDYDAGHSVCASPISTDEIWILLTRHVTDTQRTSEYISLRTQVEDADEPIPRHTDAVALKGQYISSMHVLARTRIEPSSKSISVTASYDGPYDDVGYTITAYSASANIAWSRNLDDLRMPFKTKVRALLTGKNSGGNATFPSYMMNPQYHLRVLAEAGQGPKVRESLVEKGNTRGTGSFRKAKVQEVAFTLQGPRDVPLNVTVVYSQGERVNELTRRDIAASSAAYSYGLITFHQNLPVGNYTVIVSAFEPEQCGPFTLGIRSASQCVLEPIPQEGSGMFSKVIRSTWQGASAAGGPSSKQYTQNPTFEITVSSSTHAIIRLQLMKPSSTVALNVTLFHAPDGGTALGRHIATSGPYSDAVSGVVIPKTHLAPGTYYIVPSTFNAGIEAPFRLIVYTTTATTITAR
ncbi:hypothetical protein PLICRDRAFT_34480 [Plicaturopsis crispa FD-325 SS-3]|nr:hypothetical protein PLICRDRAFT_34480 [Plicaturopsis crispa FD-325 SS-3]